ncbi:MAG: hypothetical protein R2883_04645 [Caldisericia bacterium]
MKIDPVASFYLSIVYKGEIILKQANMALLHTWAEDSLSDIYEVYLKTQEFASYNQVPSFSETLSETMRILPGNPKKERKQKKVKRDYSMEFLETLTKSMGGKMNPEKDGFELSDDSPSYSEALSGIKLLMSRAHNIQMVPKGIWFIGVFVSSILFLLSVLLLFYRTQFTEFLLLGSTLILLIYCFLKWSSYPNFPEVAEYIKDLEYSRASVVDDEVKLGKIADNG